MTTAEKVIKTKVGLLELGKQLGNVSKACRVMGYSRDSFYRFRISTRPAEKQRCKRFRGARQIRNRIAEKVESAVVELAIEEPAWGQVRVANELKRKAISISPAGMRCVWLRHDLENINKRLKTLEAKSLQEGLVLTDAQIAVLEKAKEDKEAHGEFESERPGYCGAQDTFYVGTLKGVGRIYQETFIDTDSKVSMAKLYDRKTPIAAADLLNYRVLPFFEEHEIALSRVLTDGGTEYCGRDAHEYELNRASPWPKKR